MPQHSVESYDAKTKKLGRNSSQVQFFKLLALGLKFCGKGLGLKFLCKNSIIQSVLPIEDFEATRLNSTL